MLSHPFPFFKGWDRKIKYAKTCDKKQKKQMTRRKFIIKNGIIYIDIDYIGQKVITDANFPNSSNPWFNRGGNYGNGINAGVFNFNNSNGGDNNNNSARAVVSAPRLYC